MIDVNGTNAVARVRGLRLSEQVNSSAPASSGPETFRPSARWFPISKVEPSRWLSPYPYPMPYDRHGEVWLSDRFAHVVQVFHPAYYGAEPVTVSRIAHAFGKVLTPKMNIIGDLCGNSSPNYKVPGLFDERPEQGFLPDELINPFSDHFGDEPKWGLIWEGFADVCTREWLNSGVVDEDSPNRYRCARQESRPDSGLGLGRSMSFWWPDDHSWCVGTGLDSEDTLIATNDRGRVNKLLADPRLETLYVEPKPMTVR
ncbi:hypothetical protein B2J88_44440 [Rhodococcus sp. SRB_17]|nr:hypothetical protein [Rhodococcus sp. SRB_17]